jgi:hypothetical protein
MTISPSQTLLTFPVPLWDHYELLASQVMDWYPGGMHQAQSPKGPPLCHLLPCAHGMLVGDPLLMGTQDSNTAQSSYHPHSRWVGPLDL